MNPKILLLAAILILLSSNVLAECTPKTKIVDRLKDVCKSEGDGVCDDAEYPDTADCALTMDALSCGSDRCVFKELWFAKILILALALIFLYHKKDYNIIVLVLVAMLIVGFTHAASSLTDKNGSGELSASEVSQEDLNNNLLLKYGHEVMPSNASYGAVIILIAAFFIIKYFASRTRFYLE